MVHMVYVLSAVAEICQQAVPYTVEFTHLIVSTRFPTVTTRHPRSLQIMVLPPSLPHASTASALTENEDGQSGDEENGALEDTTGAYESEEGGEYEEEVEEGSEEGGEGQEDLGEEVQEEVQEDETEEESEEEEEEEDDDDDQQDEEQAPIDQSIDVLNQKPLTSRQRKEQEKIARQIERLRKKEEKERDKAERIAKRERERIERAAKKQQQLDEFQKAKQDKLIKTSRASIGKSNKPSGSNSSIVQPKKIKVDSRIETVRRLITSTPTGELYIQNTNDPKAAEADPNARWCETKTYKGVTYLVEEDELILPNDPKGDLKVTLDGVLIGDRQYKIPTFTSKARANPNKHFVLSIDAARAAGYRDSLYFFRRNPLIQKLPCTQDEKDALIAAGFLSGNLKSRAVTMCSARNAFKVMGARFLKGGKHVVDDYYEDAAFASGATIGEPAIADGLDPQDRSNAPAADAPGQDTISVSNSNAQPVQEPVKLKPTQSAFRLALNYPISSTSASGGSSSKSNYSGDGRPPFGFVVTDPREKKRRPAPNLTSKNWMLQYCRAISEMNRHLRTVRRERSQPFPSYGTGDLRSESSPILADGEVVEPHLVEMEWRDVEVDMRINGEGRIVESGDESDTKTEEDEDEKSDTEPSTPVPPPSNPGPQLSRITNPLPPDSIITVYGLENASRTTESSHLHERNNAHLGVLTGGAHSRAHSPAHGSHNRARARSPHKRLPKPSVKKPKNQWWTTTIKVCELRPKEPVMGLLDVHTGLPHVRQDTQPTMAIIEKLDNKPHLDLDLDHKRRKRDDDMGQTDTVNDQMDLDEQPKKVCKLPMVSVETIITDELCTSRPPLIPGMWDFRSEKL
ncbi:hypothetical protein CROQUDRAFT_101108 [Cronartium quercuum f. sp. fusiforme G11]|uniref:Uncharacterized protein n=1 Tax=Cronartium quercuum f. sp. fusiforme G11 TaxID=708437 RepID=A0A9P6N8K2_9BASI|nr:hypothetical protein CROQUDRAFT_101108 [Cronartium quercuum f. sp. fusiforme G11]